MVAEVTVRRVKIEPFEMERWQSLHENDVELNLSDSGVHPLSLGELVEFLDGDSSLEELLSQPLEYTHTNGTPALRQRIADLYEGASPDNVEVTTGGVEANCVSAWTLVEPGDEVVVMVPNYGQLPGLVRGLGAKVVPWELRPNWETSSWSLDLEELERVVSPRTRMILLCNPNNPTGAIVGQEVLDGVLAIAARHGTWVLADEIYAGSELDGSSSPTIWGRGERVIVTNSLSKAYGLPGLRLGWIVAPAEAIDAFWTRHDYMTIGPSALSDRLAESVLRPVNRDRFLERTRTWLQGNLELVRTWLAERPDLEHIPPQAGAMAWIRCRKGVASDELVEELRTKYSLLLVSGEHFSQPGWIRIGFGATPARLKEGLCRLAQALD